MLPDKEKMEKECTRNMTIFQKVGEEKQNLC